MARGCSWLCRGSAAQYPLSRSTYNSSGACWQFEAAGGQSSLEVPTDLPRFGHEINLFCGRSRSMLVLLWKPDGSELASQCHWCRGISLSAQ